MSLENWDKIKEIFLEAVDLSPAERAQFLAENCADAQLRAEVEQLLRQDEEAESLWSRPALEKTAAQFFAESLESSDPLIGEMIGAYRLIGEIGRGGMGTVYAAERADDAFRRRVAVKLIKRGMETEFLLRRFRTERQVLAALNHPFIARLFDGGTTEGGLPYFVMEYVAGEPLYTFCDERRLKLKRRLEIFLQVCEAVDAAHQIKVVHRDLKPSNILVKADGTPKLLDFGIAKLLDAELSDATIEPTATAMRLMTPEYASPEQVTGDAITPASDVYSLGVILYELLSGHRPYRLKNRSPLEIARVVCEEAPRSLSRSLEGEETIPEKGEATTLDRISAARGANPDELREALSGDLEYIVMKALRKRADERYPTALELAADIRLFLAGKPIKKQFPVRAEQHVSSKELKLSLAVLPLRVISTASESGADQQYLSIGLADSLITRLSRIGRFVVCPTSSILRFAEAEDAFRAGEDLGVDFVIDGNIRFAGNRIRVTAQLLDVNEHATHWAESFDEECRDVLKLEDSISEKVTNALVPQLTTTEKQKLARRETNDTRAYEAYLKGRFYWNQFTPEALPKAFESFQCAVELDPNYALAYVGLADFYIWANIYGLMPSKPALAEAETYARRAARLNETLGEACATLGFVMQSRRQWAEAEKLKLKAIELAPHYHHAHEWYADQLVALGRTEEGIRESLSAERLAPHSPRAKTMVAFAFYQARRFEEALRRARAIIELDENFPSGHSVTGIVLWAMKRYAEALPHLRRFNEMIPDSPYAKYQLCFGLAGAGRMTEARKVLAEMKALARKAYVKPHFLGLACVAVGDFDEAFEHFEQSFAEDDPWMLWFGVEPMLEALRGDERYVDLLRRLDNPLAEKYASLPKATENKKSEAPKSIAVLPLRIFGVETGERTSDEYLSIGLADAMISRLSNVRRLMVRPTSSILHLREATDAFEAGRALAVNYVLTGTAHRVGGRIRISAQLLDVKSKAAIWAENFDEHFTDVLDLEDTVAEKVANLLIPKLTGEEKKQLQKRGTNSPAAYEAYMRGRYLANQFTNEAFVKSFAAFEDAVRLDPDYTLPRVGMAEFYVWSSVFGTLSSHEAYPKAKEALTRALAIDDRLAEAYALQSFVALLYDWNWADAERLVRKALEINPNHSFAHNTLAHVLATKGAGEEALREIRIAESLDPLSPLAKVMTSCISYQSRHFEEAATKARQASDMQLTFPQAFLHLGNALPHCGAATEAVEVLTTLSELWRDSPVPKFMLCFALVAAGETEKAQDVARGIASLAEKQFVKPYFVAMAQAAVGERGRAFEWFEKAVDERDEWMIWFGTDVKLEPLRGDERYFEILRRTNNPIAARLRRKTEKTIAVLPLRLFGAPTGASSEDEYLGVGLADAMISRLSNVRRLMVRPTSSILQFANAADDFEAGRELGADYVLTGTMRRAGGRIRISAQLLDVQSKAAIWAENFNEELTDVLDLEDVVAERVANLLIPKLTGDERQKLARRRTDSPEAFEAYLRGRYHLFQATPREFAKAKIYFEEAVRLDADYALAYTGLAEYYFVLGAFAPVSPVECYSKAREMAQRALAIDDSLGEAYATLGHLAISNFELEKAARLLERSVELSPNHSLAAMWRSILFVCYGRYDEAVAESRRAIELNPLGAFEKAHHAFILYQARRFDEATAAGRRAIADDPNFSHGIGTVSWIFRSMGLTGEAVELARRAVETSGGNPWLVCNLAACLGKAGETETARGILRDLESSTETFVLPCRMAIAYFNVGDADRTIAELEKAYEMKDPLLVWLSSEPEIDSLRADERLIDLERRVKNAQFSKSAD